MVQFYFLSILANLVGGLALSAGYLEKRFPGLSGVREFFAAKPGLRVFLGVTAATTGFLKLLSATAGDVRVVGDLVPALCGLLLGTALLFDRYREKSTVSSATVEKVDRMLAKKQSLIGVVGVVVGLLHFLLPGVLLL